MQENKQSIRRGDIYFADLNPVVGSEQGGIRPVLVLQNNTGNRHSPTIIVAAITGSPFKPPLPTHVALGRLVGLHKDSTLLLEQIRTIDRIRLGGYVGTLEPAAMDAVDSALAVSFGLIADYN